MSEEHFDDTIPPSDEQVLGYRRAWQEATTPDLARADTPAPPGYEILGELGRGGMGVVYRARHLGLGRVVALKMILSGGHAGPEEMARFRAEAEALARMQHPGIVQVFDVGESEGRPFFAMEYVEGGSLANRLGGAPLPAAAAARLTEALARAVAAAHERGVVHRDLKPANVLLSPGTAYLPYQPKITDFGLAKRLDGVSRTQTGAVMGTPCYMAPEQAAGKEVGPPADIYALGVLLYECLTGRPPLAGADIVETLQLVRYQEPVPPSRVAAGVPRDLETIALKCLQKEPPKRYSSAAALADDLKRHLGGQPILARPTSAAERAWKWAKRRPAVAALSAATALSLLLGLSMSFVALARYASEQAERGRAEGAEKRLDEQEWATYTSGLARAQRLWVSDVAGESLLVPGLLASLPKDKRGWEWALYQTPRRTSWGRIRETTSRVNSIAYGPDGRLFAIGVGEGLTEGGKARDVQLWDLVAKKQLPPLVGHTDPVTSVAFSPDGKHLAAASEWYDEERFGRRDLSAPDQTRGRVLVWELATRRVVHDIGDAFRSARFSGDGRRFFAAGPKRVARVWDCSALPWRELPSLPERKGHVVSVVPSPDGKRLVTLTLELLAVKPGDIRTPMVADIWDVDAAKPLFRLAHPGLVQAAAYSPDGRRLVTGGEDGAVRLWDAATGQLQQTCWGHTGGLRAVAFSRDGSRVASGGVDEALKLWDAFTGREVATFRGHGDSIQTIAFEPPGRDRLASGDKDGFTRLWDLAGARQPRELLGHSLSFITDIAFGGEGALLVSACRGEARAIVWDLAKGEPRHRLNAVAEKVAITQDGSRVATAGGDDFGKPGELKLWSASGELVREIDGHPDYVLAAAFSPDGRLLLSASGNTYEGAPGLVKLHDAATGDEKASFRPESVVSSVAWHPDGGRVALACQGLFAIVCRPDGGEPRRFEGLEDQFSALAFSRDGKRLACGDRSGTIAIWDFESGKLLRRMPGHRSMVTKLSFHPGGDRLASASAGLRRSGGTVDLRPAVADVRLWDVPAGREVLVVPGLYAAAFSPDGRKLALVGREADLWTPGRIEVWDATPAR